MVKVGFPASAWIAPGASAPACGDRVKGRKGEVGKEVGGRTWRGCAQVNGGYE